MRVKVKASSNIAFLKYWGKSSSEQQWPANDSLSMTLRYCHTITEAWPVANDHHQFMGQTKFCQKKPLAHLEWLERQLGFSQKLAISSTNSFPASCGIASSASGLGALTLAALGAWTQKTTLADLVTEFSLQELAQLMRKGSGSSCRSLFGGYVLWQRGTVPKEQHVSQVFTHSHWQLADTIVVLSQDAKTVGSTEGHARAWESPLFPIRLAAISERKEAMLAALRMRDLATLGPWLEAEALEMHSVMLSSQPPLDFLTQPCIEFLVWLRQWRIKTGTGVYFTLDAGSNPHLISELGDQDQICQAIHDRFGPLMLIKDRTGDGPSMETSGEL